METDTKKMIGLVRFIGIMAVAIFAVIVIAFSILVPRVLTALAHAEETLSNADILVGAASESLITANKALESANEAAQAANQLVKDNAEAVTEAMGKINDIDFESLNNAINDLESIVAPLAKVASIFN